jgi:hypothetical protein
LAGLLTRTTDSNKKFNPHLHIRKHADEDFLCTQQYFHRKSSSYLSPSTKMPLLPKCHLPHPLSKTTFFSRPAAHPLKIRKQNRLSNTKKKHNHTNTHTKSKQKSKPNTSNHKNQKQTPQKDNPKQPIKHHQLENTPTQTAIQIQQTPSPIPLRNHTPQNARTFPLKRKCISLQTPKSSLPNASAFHLKYKDV